jgi:hypothetical protein
MDWPGSRPATCRSHPWIDCIIRASVLTFANGGQYTEFKSETRQKSPWTKGEDRLMVQTEKTELETDCSSQVGDGGLRSESRKIALKTSGFCL